MKHIFLANIHLRKPTNSDAKNIVALHKQVGSFNGMVQSLDITKIHWTNWPMTWKAQFQLKEKFTGIGLEVVAYTNLRFCHTVNH
jgi:hypothetical protein